MLNTTSIYSNLSSSPYMTPTRSRSRTAAINTGRDSGADYFSASSADFGYDLFLHGVVNCDSACNSSSTSTGNGTTSGFFSRCRSNRPFFASSQTSSAGNNRQSTVARTHQWNGGMFSSITSLNRSSFHEQHHYTDRTNFDISSQQQRMKSTNLLASNLSLGNLVPLNTCATVVNSGASINSRPNVTEETNRKQQRSQQSRATNLVDHFESENVDNLSHQQLHALHRFRRQKKKGFLSRLRDVVISFTPKARLSIVNRHEVFIRFGKEEKETLACFDFLDKFAAVENNTETLSVDEISSDCERHDSSLVTIEDVLHGWQVDAPTWPNETANQTCCDKSLTIASLATFTATTAATCTSLTTDQGISNKKYQVQDKNFDTSSGHTPQDDPIDVDSVEADVVVTGQSIDLSDKHAESGQPDVTENESLSTGTNNQSVESENMNEAICSDSESQLAQPPVQQPQQQRSNSGGSGSGKQSKKKWRQKSKSKQSKQTNKTR